MKKIIIFGAGCYGRNAYFKMKDQYEILYFVDNNILLDGTELFGIPVISGTKLKEVYFQDMEVIICVKNYSEISSQLNQIGIRDYYILLGGFLYHSSPSEAVVPYELNHYAYIQKERNEKNILFVQDMTCIRTNKLAAVMKSEGYKVYLLYTMAPPESNNEYLPDVYDSVFTFYTAAGIIDFVENSSFDIVHSSNEPDVLTNLLLRTGKPIVFDTHDMMSIRKPESIENLTLEYIANTYSDGNMYTSQGIAEIARKKYRLENKEILSLENMILDCEVISNPHKKLSSIDGKLHCIYEGGVAEGNRWHHRFFEDIWKKITDLGIHIHFYSQSDYEYCRELESKSPYIHYEGNMELKKLLREMTKYDCGLAISNVNAQNKTFLETSSPNKIYEYLNAGIPVAVGDIQSHVDFVRKYGVGEKVDLNGDIKKQIDLISRITIEENFLTNNKLTMMSRSQEIVDFYERVKKRRKI